MGKICRVRERNNVDFYEAQLEHNKWLGIIRA